MNALQHFLERNFIWFFLFCFVCIVGNLAWRWRRQKRSGMVFPNLPPEKIRFEEHRASGYSHKSWFTRHGGARNCLHVTVTDAEVWIRLPFPFILIAREGDMEHRIAKSSIVSLQPRKSTFAQSIDLEYRDEQSGLYKLSLILKRPDDFMRAVAPVPQTSSTT